MQIQIQSYLKNKKKFVKIIVKIFNNNPKIVFQDILIIVQGSRFTLNGPAVMTLFRSAFLLKGGKTGIVFFR